MSTIQQQTSTPDRFLADHEPQRDWRIPPGVEGVDPVTAFDGCGAYPLEVALATAAREPSTATVRDLWAKRHENAPNPLLTVIAYRASDRWHASLCGPAGDQPPVIAGLDLSQAERLAEAALSEPSRHAAIRFLTAMLPEVGADLPGLRNHGMFATHELRDRVPERGDWQQLCEQARPLLQHRGRDLVERLGFRVEDHGTTTSVLAAGEQKRAVAVFLDEGEVFEEPTQRFQGASPVAHALAAADRENLPWAVLTRGRQIRVYSARPDVGVGRKGRAETFVEANLALLPDDQAGYLTLLFSAQALLPGGTFEHVLDESRDYAADLSTRLRDRVYTDAVPALATALATRRGDATLDEVYDQALNVLFRLLFVAYAEDKDLLPYRSNGLYRERSLKALARQLAERRLVPSFVFDANDTALWDHVVALWRAVDIGNVELGVPPYNGGLFSSDPKVNKAGAALAEARLTNAEFGPALAALLVDATAEEVVGPVDFRSLSVREFGTIYEGLLESNLSLATTDLTVDDRANYVPAQDGDEIVVAEAEVYFHNRSGARKSTGSYFTKPFAVEYLLDHALEPALDMHIARITHLLDAHEEARAAAAFFDFRCVDLAMGSGHFLVAAIDRIEARLSALLADHPIAQVAGELERLRKAAYDALGPLGEGIEIEHSSLLRRQVARRCIYGVDRNTVAVELARLGIWIHTFVPGLPLSFLDHGLVEGDSLTGVGAIDEAVRTLDPGDETHMSIFREPIMHVLGRAETALVRLARLSDATAAEIKDARTAQEQAQREVDPARHLFDLITAARLGEAQLPTAFDDGSIAAHPDRVEATKRARELRALHFPIAFPEVFLRDNPGFDCVIGNPPWDKVLFEPQQFWVARSPGLNALPVARREAEIERLRQTRPEDAAAEVAERTARERFQHYIEASFPNRGRGHYDYAKLFVERAMGVMGSNGAIGYVLPRQALVLSGWTALRELLFSGRDSDVAQARNRGGWLFDDVEPRYMVVFLSSRPTRSQTEAGVKIRAGITSSRELRHSEATPATYLTENELRQLSDGLVVPWFDDSRGTEVFDRMRSHPRLASGGSWIEGFHDARWDFRGSGPDGRFTESSSTTGSWSILMTRHVDAYRLALEEPFTKWVDPRRLLPLGRGIVDDDRDVRLNAEHPLIVVRHPSRNDDARTLICTALPAAEYLHNKGYVHAVRHVPTTSDTDLLALLGFLNSYACDWWARRFVDRHITAPVINNIPLPRWSQEQRLRAAQLASALLARNDYAGELAGARSLVVTKDLAMLQPLEIAAELDMLAFLGFGLGQAEANIVLDDFSVNGCPPAVRVAILERLG